MKFNFRKTFLVGSLLCITFLFAYSERAFSQSHLKGRVLNIRDGKPVAFASIGTDRARGKAVSDAQGNFYLKLSGNLKNDSVFISSVGYRTLKLPARDAITRSEFILSEEPRDLQPVVLYSGEAEVGSRSEKTAYFRSWNTNKTGGEIGKIVHVGQKNYKLEKVRFKVSNPCDTCLIRLHIREVIDERPGEEILTDSITTMVKRISFDDGFSEFDLRSKNLVFKNSVVFVGLEVLSCSLRDGELCYFCFNGTERGEYLYKSTKDSDWEPYSDYSIYLKFYYKY